MSATKDPYGVDTVHVRRAFNAAAHTYGEAAVLQAEVRARLLERLEAVAVDPARVLDAGAGTGLAAPGLAARFPGAGLVLLDLADGMLREANDQGLAAVCADAAELPFRPGAFGLVFSNLMLQWAPDLDRVLGEFRRVLTGGGLLVFSTFGPDTLAELRAAWAGADGYTHVNRFIDMHDVGDALIRSGFAEPVLDLEHFTLTYPDLRALMGDLKAIGARNVTAGRRRGLTGRGRLAAAEREYERWRRDGRLVSTWEVIYGIAWVPEHTRARESAGSRGEVRIAPDRIGRRQ
jgi:malonyl-CoA O-methyltransferase